MVLLHNQTNTRLPAGTKFSITYRVEDQAGNFDQVTRTVTIIDTTPPVISIRGAPSIRHEAATPYIDDGATATDTLDGDVSVAVSGEVNIHPDQVPATFTLTYTAVDNAGNTQTAKKTIEVFDTTPPTLSLLGGDMAQGGVSVPFGTIYRDPGVQASDSYAGDVSSRVLSSGRDTIDVYRAGIYTVTYTVEDFNSNAITAYRAVVVQRFDFSESTPLVRLVLTANITQSSPLLPLEAALSSALGEAYVFIVTLRDRNGDLDFNLLSRFDSGRRRREDPSQNSTHVVDFAARDYLTLEWMAARDILSNLSHPDNRAILFGAGVTVIEATETKSPSSSNKEGGGTSGTAAGAAGAAAFVFVAVAALLSRRRRRTGRARAVFKSDVVDMLALDRSRIRLGSQLGSFGDAGLLRDAWVMRDSEGGEEAYLALEAGTDFSAFQRQAELRAVAGDNCNILGLCGRCSSSVSQLILFERVSAGNLRDQLRLWRGQGSGGGVSLQQLKALCMGVMDGLGHVHGAGVALGHVCAANVTLDDRLTPKLSSFHYARRIMQNTVNDTSLAALVEHQLHSRWLAPEMLLGAENGATVAGDIWALGVTVWEICTLAATPYVRLQETEDVLASLSQKKRLTFPPWATRAGAGELSNLCWRTLTEMRGEVPQVRDVVRRFPSDGALATDDLPPVAAWDGAPASAAMGAIAASEARSRLRTGARQRTATAISITRGAADWMRSNPTYAAGEQSDEGVAPATWGIPIISPSEEPALPGEYLYAKAVRASSASDAVYAAVEGGDHSSLYSTLPISPASGGGYSSLTPDHEVYNCSQEAVTEVTPSPARSGKPVALAPGYTALEPEHMVYEPGVSLPSSATPVRVVASSSTYAFFPPGQRDKNPKRDRVLDSNNSDV
jgi:hypothetical protein